MKKRFLPRRMLEDTLLDRRTNNTTTGATKSQCRRTAYDLRKIGILVEWDVKKGTYELNDWKSRDFARTLLRKNWNRKTVHVKDHPQWEPNKSVRRRIFGEILGWFLLSLGVFLLSASLINYFFPLTF